MGLRRKCPQVRHYRYVVPEGLERNHISTDDDSLSQISTIVGTNPNLLESKIQSLTREKNNVALKVLSNTNHKMNNHKNSNNNKKNGSISSCSSSSNNNNNNTNINKSSKSFKKYNKEGATHNVIHCRLCDKTISNAQINMLYDYEALAETKLGRKMNIILNTRESYTELSNYCCDVCTMKIQICFSLLIEIQASDEVIRQTYQHLTKGLEVNTSVQKFLCEECKSTVTGIKSFIRHYENHILKKTIVGAKGEIRIAGIVPLDDLKKEIDIKVEADDSVNEIDSVHEDSVIYSNNNEVHVTHEGATEENYMLDLLESEYVNSKFKNKFKEELVTLRETTTANYLAENKSRNCEKACISSIDVKAECSESEHKEFYVETDVDDEVKMDVTVGVDDTMTVDKEIECNNEDGEDIEMVTDPTLSEKNYQELVELVKLELGRSDDDDDEDGDDFEGGGVDDEDENENENENEDEDEDEEKDEDKEEEEEEEEDDGGDASENGEINDIEKDDDLKLGVLQQNQDGEYVCDTCDLSFQYKFLLIHHLKINHQDLNTGRLKRQNDNNDFTLMSTCKYCVNSLFIRDFRKHIIDCKIQFYLNDRKVLCEVCGKCYDSKQWVNHTRKHETYPHPDGWPCEICGKKFKAKRFLLSHLGEHDESKKKICEICGKKLLPLSLFSHMLKHKEKKHVCTYCGKAFTYLYSLRIHLRVHEGGPRVDDSKFTKRREKIKCWYCKEECENVDGLNKHLKEEHNAESLDQESRFPCSECDKKFGDMFSLKAHLKLIHEMKDEDIAKFKSLPVYRCIECNVCQKIFNSENKVRMHMKHDHGLKPFEMEVLKKECEKCGKKFASKQNLIHHINGAHLHIKPMSCDICQEKFAKHSSLIYHKLRHSGEKPFQCEFCKKSYRQRNDVIRHLARHVRDNELELEEASAINTSPSPLVIKRRIFLKDSSINYQSVVRKSRRGKNNSVAVDATKMNDSVVEEPSNVTEFKEEEEEDISESMIYIEEVVTDDIPTEDAGDFRFMTVKPVYNENDKTIILSNPNEVKNVTYRCIPSQLKHMPAVIVKKQEQI